MKLIELECNVCGKSYLREPYAVKNSRFCSLSCKSYWISQNRKQRDEDWETKFYSLIDKTPGLGPNGDCWEWRGTVNSVHGYGNIRIKGKNNRTHRLSFKLFKGEIPENMVVMHSCDHKICLNPDHLSLGTTQENTKDRDNKGRQNKGEDRYNHKLTKEKVLEMRSLYEQGILNTYQLAEKFGVVQSTVWNIIKRNRWKHV